ncbi:ComF family protein [Patescibacteria group bacterium]|nr:MAG: ComF family protein [Patescibacteria group bacterium]
MEGGFGRVGQVLNFWREWILDAVFPERCAGCGRDGSSLCGACLADLSPRPERRILKDGTEVTAFYPYGDPRIRVLLGQYKFYGRTALKAVLAKLLDKAVRGAPSLLPAQPVIVVPVPLAPRRERQRGFNQSAELAKILLQHLPPSSQLILALKRNRNTTQQATLIKNERAKNVVGAFVCGKQEFGGRATLLVDDVVTSGETIRAAAGALRQAGYKKISAFALAHAPND